MSQPENPQEPGPDSPPSSLLPEDLMLKRPVRLGLGVRLRNYFLAGILITAPVSLTVYIAWLFISWVDQAVLPMVPPEYNPERYLPFSIPGIGLIIVLLVLTTIGAELAMPWLIHLFAPGFDAIPEKFAATVLFTSITFPYIVFMSLCALQGGMLNGVQKFGQNAVTPVILNAILVASMWFIRGDDFFVGKALSWSVTLAGLVQFLWLTYACHRAGLRLRLPWPRFTPDVRRLCILMVPGLIGSSVNQINLAVSTILASLHPGSVSYIYYADRLYQLPLALIGFTLT